MTSLRRRVSLALTCLAAAGLGEAFAAFWIAKNHGFGRGDLSSYAFWNLLFAIYLYAVATVLQPRLHVAHVGVRVFAWTLIGGVAGFLWTWIVAVALGPWIGAFSFPVLYIWTAAGAIAGAAIGWRATADVTPRRRRPWLVLLVPPVTLLGVVLLEAMLYLGSRFVWGRAQPEVFTFPDRYIGQAYVIYDSVAGRPLRAAGRTRRYDLPASGVFVTKSDFVRGWLDEHFFYRRPDGTETEIRARWDATIDDTPANRADTTVGVYFRTWGQRTEGECTLRYTSFFVGRKADVLDNRGVDGLESYVHSCLDRHRDDSVGKHEAPGTA